MEEAIRLMNEETKQLEGPNAEAQPQLQLQRWTPPWSGWSFSESWMAMALWWCATPCVAGDANATSSHGGASNLAGVQDHLVKVEKNMMKTKEELDQLDKEREAAIAEFRAAIKAKRMGELPALGDAVTNAAMLHDRKKKTYEYLCGIRIKLRLYIQNLTDRERQFVQLTQLEALAHEISEQDADADNLRDELRLFTEQISSTATTGTKQHSADNNDRIRAAVEVIEQLEGTTAANNDEEEKTHDDDEPSGGLLELASLAPPPTHRIVPTAPAATNSAVAALDLL